MHFFLFMHNIVIYTHNIDYIYKSEGILNKSVKIFQRVSIIIRGVETLETSSFPETHFCQKEKKLR